MIFQTFNSFLLRNATVPLTFVWSSPLFTHSGYLRTRKRRNQFLELKLDKAGPGQEGGGGGGGVHRRRKAHILWISLRFVCASKTRFFGTPFHFLQTREFYFITPFLSLSLSLSLSLTLSANKIEWIGVTGHWRLCKTWLFQSPITKATQIENFENRRIEEFKVFCSTKCVRKCGYQSML